MDVIGELIARALATPDDDAALGDGPGRGRSGCAGSSRCIRTTSGPDVDAVAAVVRRRTARWRARSPDFEPRAGPGRDGRRRRATCSRTAACCWPKPAPAPARRSPTWFPPSSAASACSSPPAPRTCRNRSTSRTSRRCATALGVPFTATCMKGRAQLPVPAPARVTLTRRRRSARRPTHDVFLPIIREWAARTDDRRPRRARGSARGPAVLERGRRRPPKPASAPSARATTTASSPACASAPPNPTWSSSTTTCCAPTPRCGRARYGEVIPACSHAVVDEAHQLEDVATQYFGFASATTGSRSSRATSSGCAAPAASPTAGDRDEIAKAVDAAARSRPRVLRRARVRASRRAAGAAARSGCARPPTSLADTPRAAAAISTGALDVVEVDAGAAASRSRRRERRRRRPDRRRDDAATLARRAGRAARRAAVPAARRRPGLRLLRRVPRHAASSCAPRRSTSRRSCASCCSTGCARPC